MGGHKSLRVVVILAKSRFLPCSIRLMAVCLTDVLPNMSVRLMSVHLMTVRIMDFLSTMSVRLISKGLSLLT